MWTLPSIGCCALLSQALSMWGSFAQIRLNRRRASTSGLSYFYWESRIWSKLPWFAFGVSLKSFDWSLISSIALALIPPFIVLHQFQKYQRSKATLEANRFGFRLRRQYGLLFISGAIAIVAREQVSQLGVLLSILPVVCTMIAVAGGGATQFRCNQTQGNCHAVAGERYILLVVSNLLWLNYGFTKGVQQGWQEAWTICCCSTIGVLVYLILAIQFAILKVKSSNQPVAEQPIIIAA